MAVALFGLLVSLIASTRVPLRILLLLLIITITTSMSFDLNPPPLLLLLRSLFLLVDKYNHILALTLLLLPLHLHSVIQMLLPPTLLLLTAVTAVSIIIPRTIQSTFALLSPPPPPSPSNLHLQISTFCSRFIKLIQLLVLFVGVIPYLYLELVKKQTNMASKTSVYFIH